MTTKSLVIRHMDASMEYLANMHFIAANHTQEGIFLELIDKNGLDVQVEKVAGFVVFDEE